MGSFCTGGNQVTQDKTQSYTPSAQGLGALNSAQSWLSGINPGNAPLLNTNGLNSNQTGSYQGFGDVAQNNPSNPYFQAGSNFLNQSVQAPDTQSFLNPYNQYQLENWKQYAADPAMRNARTGAVGAAGGVGAERNALADQNAAFNTNQQLGGILQNQWNSAAGQAQQQRQNQQAAGALNFAAAPQALNTQLAAFGAQQGSGNNMWGYQQLPNQAQYQQQEQQFQTPFQLAQMYSQMAPAYGGTQTGQQTTTYPQQSPMAQIAGTAMAVAPFLIKRGGRIPSFADGGMAWQPFSFDTVDPTKGPKSPMEQLTKGLSDGNKGGGGSGAIPPMFGESGWLSNAMGGSFGGYASGGEINPYSYADGGDIEDELYGVRQSPISRIQGAFDQMEVPDKYENPGGPALPPEIISGQSSPIPRPRPAANSFAPEEEDSGLPLPVRQEGIPGPLGGGSAQASGLPAVPQFNDPSSQRAKDPKMAAFMALARALQGPKRDSHGLLEGTNPLGQAFATAGHGMESGVNFTEKQREQNRAEEMAKFNAGMQQAPYKNLTEAQRLEALKPFKIGQDPLTGVDLYGIRDLKTGKLISIDPRTGEPINQQAQESVQPGIHGEDYLNSLRKQGYGSLADRIVAIHEGREAPPSANSRSPQARILLDALSRFDPKYDLTQWGARNAMQKDLSSSGNAGKLLLATNQLLPHIKSLFERTDALDNSKYPAKNAVQNWLATQTGDDRVKRFQSIREVASMDAARLLRGSGVMAEKDIEHWRKIFNEAGSPAQLKGVMRDLAIDLIDARVSSIEHQYRTVMGKEPPRDLVSKEAKEAREYIEKNWNVQKEKDKPVAKPSKPQKAATISDDERAAALDWISKNPDDPRVANIKKKLGIQ